MTSLAQALGVLIAGIFVLAATAKLMDYNSQGRLFWLPYPASEGQRYGLLAVLIVTEYGVALTLLVPPNTAVAMVLVWAVMPALTLYGRASIKATGRCGCFGSASQVNWTGSFVVLLVRNTLLLSGATISLSVGHQEQATSEGGWPIHQAALLMALLLPWIGLAALALGVVVLQSSLRGRSLLLRVRRLTAGDVVIP